MLNSNKKISREDLTDEKSSVILIKKACGLRKVRRIIMNTAVTVVCCLIPCIGIVMGLMIMRKGKMKKEMDGVPGAMSSGLLIAIGTRILTVTAVLLVLTVLLISFVPTDTARMRLVTAILMVTVQYAAAIGLIFSINGMIKKDKVKRKEIQEKENA